MRSLTVDNAMSYLSDIASTLTPEQHRAVNIIFIDQAFAMAPGSTKFHHDYLGGLALHTAEVVQNCLMLMGAVEYSYEDDDLSDVHSDLTKKHYGYNGTLDIKAVLVAALLHDYCKTLEYEYELEMTEHPDQMGLPDVAFFPVQHIKQGSIKRADYGSLVGHVVGSAMLFTQRAPQAGLTPEFADKVLHIMLSHHGRTEWKSPVEPKTPEAWILHAADMLSAQPL